MLPLYVFVLGVYYFYVLHDSTFLFVFITLCFYSVMVCILTRVEEYMLNSLVIILLMHMSCLCIVCTENVLGTG